MTAGYRPLVATVAYHLAKDRVARWPEGGYGVPGPYLDSLRRAGARTAIIAPGDPGDPEELLDPFDGLLLVGGGDLEPARYGQPPGPELYGLEPDRDEAEIGLLRAADRMALPTLCICRGMQVMNVAFGGSLHQHLPGIPGLIEHGVPLAGTQTLHRVTVEPGTRLSATTKAGGPLLGLSHHHQGVDRLGEGLAATGRSDDGLVEAIERIVDDPEDPSAVWMLGVQWHPEETAAADPIQQALFDGLTLLARLRGSRAKPGEAAGRTRDYRIVEPDAAWTARFDAESIRVLNALPTDLVSRIDHVGSTAVPGLRAKPTVDIQLSVTSMAPRSAYVDPLRALGYVWAIDPIDDEHEYFSLDASGERTFQIHVCLAGGAWERRHLLFRDWLRTHSEDAAAYSELKGRLAAAHPRDVYAYVDGKTTFIRSIEERAGSGARTSAG
jgi:putative glutamine amidotransferase